MSESPFCLADDVAGLPRVIYIERVVVAREIGSDDVSDGQFFEWALARRQVLNSLAKRQMARNQSVADEIRITEIPEIWQLESHPKPLRRSWLFARD